jgi:serine beta-lactamase-like protein LACTB, mitochondrial
MTQHKARTGLFLVAVATAPACRAESQPALPLQATPETRVANPAFAATIDSAARIVAALTTASPAISVSVAVGSGIVWSAAFGFSDLEHRTPATPASRFRAYSLSKGLTAAAALALRDQGKLDFDAPIARYVSRFKDPTSLITARLLAGHLSGIRHYRGQEALWTRSCTNTDEGIDVFAKDRLESPPGTKYLYSSWGYVLLSGVVASAASSTFADAIEHLVLKPAGMTATGLEKTSSSGLVSFYEPRGKIVVPARTVDNSCKWGAGAFVTTADDMARFGAALLGGKIIAPKSVKEMLTPMKTTAGVSTDYGMGFGVVTDSAGLRLAVHSGSAIGGRSAIVMLPDDSVVVVIMSNVEGDRLTGPAGVVARMFRRP